MVSTPLCVVGIHPELAEERELLVVVELAGIDRQPAGGETVFLVPSQPPEVAGADERDQLVILLGVVQRIVDAETGEAEVDRQPPGQLQRAVVEQVGRVGDRGEYALPADVHRHRPAEQVAEVEELQAEPAAPAAQQRPLGTEPDLAPPVPVHPVEHLGQLRHVGIERVCRQALGASRHVVEPEPATVRLGVGVLPLPRAPCACARLAAPMPAARAPSPVINLRRSRVIMVPFCNSSPLPPARGPPSGHLPAAGIQ